MEQRHLPPTQPKTVANILLVLGVCIILQPCIAAPEEPANVSGTDAGEMPVSTEEKGQEQNLLEQLAAARTVNSKRLEVGVLGELGLFYFQARQFEKAESQYLRALELGPKVLGVNHPDVARAYANLGFAYEQTQNFKKAEPVLLKAMGILAKTKQDDDCLAKVLGALGDLYYAKGDFAKADQYYGRSLAMFKRLGLKAGDNIRIQENRRKLRMDMQNRRRKH